MARVWLGVALLVSVVSHLAVVQTVDWAGMGMSQSGCGSLVEAGTRTRDAGHPCELCRLVDPQTGAKSQPARKAGTRIKKATLFAECRRHGVPAAPPSEDRPPAPAMSAGVEVDERETPPPRAV